jgi:hypothetical protein
VDTRLTAASFTSKLQGIIFSCCLVLFAPFCVEDHALIAPGGAEASRVTAHSLSIGVYYGLVHVTGFEPVISWVKTRGLGPLGETCLVLRMGFEPMIS